MIELAALIVGTVTTSLIALTVLSKNSRSITNRLFVCLAIGLVGWSATTYFSLHTSNDLQTLFWIRWIMFFVVIQTTSFFFLARVFPSNQFNLFRDKKYLIAFIYSIITAGVAISPFLFVGFQDGAPVPGPGMLLFVPHALIFVGGGVAILFTRLLKARGIERTQLQYFIAGTSILFTLVPVGNFIIPVVFKLSQFVIFSPLYPIVFSGLIAYAIVAKKMFDIRAAVARSVAYVLSLGLLIIIYVVASRLLVNRVFPDISGEFISMAINTGGFVAAVILFPYIKRFFDRITNRLFYRDAYDTQAFLDRLNKILVANVELEKLLERTSRIIEDNLKVEFCLFWIRKTSYLPQRMIGISPQKLEEGMDPIHSLASHAHSRIIVSDELAAGSSRLQAALQKNSIAILARLDAAPHHNTKDVGYMVLGPKKSGNPYSDQDIKVLRIITNELVIAIQNALRFEEIEHFNLTLQQKVDNATLQLRGSNERLKLLDESKDDFVSMASHQLRTPLTSVKGYISMVLEGDAGKVNPAQRKMLEQAFISSQRMTFLIADLLNVSRLKTGKFVIDSVPTNLASMVEQEVAQLTETAESRNLTLVYNRPSQFPELLLDETKTRQVIMNFVDNAIYYTPAGGTIEIKLEETQKSVELTVTDSGIGIPKAEQHHLFTKFYRASNAKRARPDGTGLGLFMAKKIIVAQGGATIFKSEEGKGSTFGFSFPKKLMQAPAATIDAAEKPVHNH